MSTVFKYPDGRKAVTAHGRAEMPGRALHFKAAACHAWDFGPYTPDLFTPTVMKDQAAQWLRAYRKAGGR